MKSLKHYLSIGLLAAASLIHSLNAWSVAELPVKAFASLPDVVNVKMSPNGDKLAILRGIDRNQKRAMVIEITDLTTGKKSYPVIDDSDVFDITWYKWANENIILVGAEFYKKRKSKEYLDSVKTSEKRLLILDLETNALKNIMTKTMLKRYDTWQPIRQDTVVDMLPDDPDHILHAIDWNSYRAPQVFKVNLKTRSRKMVQMQRENWIHWVTDQQHRVRVGVESRTITGGLTDDRHEYRIHVKDLKTGKWNELWRYEALTKDYIWPMGFGADPNVLFVNAYNGDFRAVYKVDLNHPEHKELVYARDDQDVSHTLVTSYLTKEAIGIRYTNSVYYWDPAFQKLSAGIDKALPHTDNKILQYSLDETKYLVYSESDTDSGTYYLGNRTTKRLDPIAFKYQALDPSQMSTVKKISYVARDGLKIDGFLTLPKGSDGKNLPTIIYPHGGPATRIIKNEFNYWTQFFANRGYAVLQMNFRGSNGLGFDFMKAGFKGWGKEMQDDVEDATHWAIQQGIADKDRICIAGGSYAGYAALMGATQTPDLYRCAISVAGISNVFKLVDQHRDWSNYQIVKDQIGEKRSELAKVSPINFVKQVKAPILLIHGDEDITVYPEQSRIMYKALKAKNKDVQYVELTGGNHHLSNNENRIQAFEAIDTFLKKNL